MIAIVDYGVGNVRSVERALEAVGARPELTSDPDRLAAANGLVLPGVGAFAACLGKLEVGGLGRRLVELAKRGKPMLGVCVGYQLLFEESSEYGHHQGLGLLPGQVGLIEGSPRLPVIGWCRLRQCEVSPLWRDIADGAYFYFVHSYTPRSDRWVLGSTDSAPAAAAGRLNVMGTQFHPEKSGADGLRVYANFVGVCGDG